MSILDGQVVLDGEVRRGNNRGGNNNGNGNFKKGNKRNYRNDNRSYGSKYYAFSKSSYLPDDVKAEIAEEEAAEENEQLTDDRADAINSFCDSFTDNIQNYRSLQDVIIDQLPDVIGYVKYYYGNKNNSIFIDALNRLITTMCTTPFANTLGSVLESGVWVDDGTYDKIWSSIAFGLSVALETSYERMHSDTVRKYAASILPRMWKPEINDVTVQAGVTKDLALDLFIAIPLEENDWNGANIDAFYHRFLDKMIIHAEDNMDVLNWEVQGILYDRMFGKGSKTALKIIGKYLVSDEITEFDSDVISAVYDDFKKMLYSKLDKYDIGDIEYVFRFVAKYRKEHPDNKIMFNSVVASEWENVRKGLLSVMDKDRETMNYLA